MATSKLPNASVNRRKIRQLLENIPGVFINDFVETGRWHVIQHGKHGEREASCDGLFVSYDVYWFLKRLVLPARIALLFQGYGQTDIGVAVVELRNIYWTGGGEDYPRLDFDHPKAMREIHGCPNFWGAFILAIAKVPSDMEIMAQKDPKFAIFSELVKTWAMV